MTEIGDENMRQAEKQIMLSAVDYRWVRHLTDLDRLREGIGLQAIAQVDPLVAYKREAFVMYAELMESIRSDIVKAVFSVHVQEQPVTAAPIARNIRTNQGASNGAAKPQTMRKSGPDLKRNDPCWCGSGKKYKQCHMKADRARVGASADQARQGSRLNFTAKAQRLRRAPSIFRWPECDPFAPRRRLKFPQLSWT